MGEKIYRIVNACRSDDNYIVLECDGITIKILEVNLKYRSFVGHSPDSLDHARKIFGADIVKQVLDGPIVRLPKSATNNGIAGCAEVISTHKDFDFVPRKITQKK